MVHVAGGGDEAHAHAGVLRLPRGQALHDLRGNEGEGRVSLNRVEDGSESEGQVCASGSPLCVGMCDGTI